MKLSSYPDLVKQWHPTKNGELTPNNITHGAHKKVWWLCSNGHSYNQIIKNKTILNYGCPQCSGRIASENNNLSIQYPKVASEWHPTKNKEFKATEVTYGSEKKAWWLCPKGHSYKATINNRTLRQSGCPQCSNQSSEPEIRILTELKYLFDNVVSRYKVDGIEIDVYLPNFNLGIEYDGEHWHKGKEEQDIEKNRLLIAKNIHIIRVREKPLEPLSEEDVMVDKVSLKKGDLNEILEKVSVFVSAEINQTIAAYIAQTSFANDELFKEYRSYFPSPFPEHSLLKTHPELSNEWDYEKNSPLRPENFSYGVRNKMWWLCPNGHSYDATINHRTGKNQQTGCPQCSGRVASENNNLSILFPEVAKEWHPTKNKELTPKQITSKSGKKVWWLCPKGHSYEAVPHNRTGMKSGCPYCAGQKSLNLDLFK
jgi:very-short-patch-repair endonuclease/uncharacterized protein YlaI